VIGKSRGKFHMRGKRILVLETEGETRKRLELELRDLGAAILGPAQSAVAALELMYDRSPDGALLDARLDAQTSFAVAEFLWREAVPFVFTTSGMALDMPPEFLGRSVSKETPLTDIAEALFGRSANRTHSLVHACAQQP
jgi:CheY-like chemotaxis protein